MMRSALLFAAVIAGALPLATHAADTGATAPAPSLSEDRLLLTGNGSTLNRSVSGGGGGSLGWLHNFNPSTSLGIAGEYQTIANAHWSFGSLSGAVGGGSGGLKWNAFAEGHEGAGDIGHKRFDYSVIAAGASGTFGSRLTILAESRQFDVDTAHGNLPKLGLSYLATPRLLLGASYARSIGGNLRSQITTARIDLYNRPVNAFVGYAFGHTAPELVVGTGAVLGQTTITFGPVPRLREGFAGLSKAFRRVEWTVLGDYQELSSTRRATVTVICTVHFNQPRAPG